MSNLKTWEAVRTPPANALREIKGGRLSGKSDINPVWRLKTLTEQFGPCGIGWKYEIIEKRLEQGANGEIAAFVDINLYIKHGEKWSEAIPGTGGSMFVEKEKAGLHVNDEAFKMALTDAISVSCKALGFAADVYWDKDSTKYSGRDKEAGAPTSRGAPQSTAEHNRLRKALTDKAAELGFSPETVKDLLQKWYGANSTANLTVDQLKEAQKKLIEEDRKLSAEARKAEQGRMA